MKTIELLQQAIELQTRHSMDPENGNTQSKQIGNVLPLRAA